MFFFPIFTIELIKLCNIIVLVYEPLLVLTFLWAHRAQITSATTGLLQKERVLQLESIKWNFKILANNPLLKMLYAQIAGVSTIQFETNQLLDKTQEEWAGVQPIYVIPNRLNFESNLGLVPDTSVPAQCVLKKLP